MHKLKIFLCSLLLLITPPHFVFSQELPSYQQQLFDALPSYNDFLRLLEEIESGEFEETHTPEQIKQMAYFLLQLARIGVLPGEEEELERDFEELFRELEGETITAAFWTFPYPTPDPAIVKAVCKSAKKHKKEILIGVAIAVAVAVTVVVVTSCPPSAGVVAGAVGALASGLEPSQSPSPNRSFSDSLPMLMSPMDPQIAAFKEEIIQQQMVQPQGLSWEERGRVFGSTFAHDNFENLQTQKLFEEFKNKSPSDLGHPQIDSKFSTNYTPFYIEQKPDLHALSYQALGETALSHGYYDQAIHNFSKAIEMNPTDPLPYLERGIAHFELGQYEHSLEDYQMYTAQMPMPFSTADFSIGFVKGLPKGIYESGSHLLLFASDLVQHPIRTSGQMWEALNQLSDLARTEQWSTLGEILVPEIHQLVNEWDTLPSDKRGELAGYALGKYGADILIPGALAKVAAKGVKGAERLSIISKELQAAEKTLRLETVAGLESSAKIGELVQLEKRVSEWLGEGSKLIRNKAGDPVFLSKDGLRRVRFDFKNSHGDLSHLHIEQKIKNRWQDASSQHRIYPNK